ncbi:MAG TPA: rhodanese-like domain-containing protein [Ktedonobacteraceae bacterium]|nr:rhodanese-like domain-containing protein [Ktedonobacteraceae bacterium]
MSTLPMKPRILALLHFARQQELQLVNKLSDGERNATTAGDAWMAKDFLVNIMLWKQLQTQKLAMALRGETPPVWRDMELVHQLNSEAFARYQDFSFSAILTESQHIFDAFIAQVESMSEEELTDPHRYDWQEGEPLWGETLGNGLWHPCNQITAYYIQHDDRQAALQTQELLIEAARRAELPPETLGVTVYNSACMLVRNGLAEKAIPLLAEALHLRPTLIEWSRHDADLDAIRADPAFEAIFQDAALTAKAPVSSLIDPQKLFARIGAQEQLMVIDVRGAGEYAAGHIQGAVNIPLGQLSKKLKQLPQERPVITYCNMHHRGESRGERAALLLRERGYQAQTIDGGYPAWKEAGLPVEEALHT